MNPIQLDSTALALTLPEPSPKPADNLPQPSFGDHLNEARRQEDRSLPREAARAEPPTPRPEEPQAATPEAQPSKAEDSTLPEKPSQGSTAAKAPQASEEKDAPPEKQPQGEVAVVIAAVILPPSSPVTPNSSAVSDVTPVLEVSIAATAPIAQVPELNEAPPEASHEDTPTIIAVPELDEPKAPTARVAAIGKEKKKSVGAEKQSNDKTQEELASEPIKTAVAEAVPEEHGDGADKPASGETPASERPAAVPNQPFAPSSQIVALTAADAGPAAPALEPDPANTKSTALPPAAPSVNEPKDAGTSRPDPATTPPAPLAENSQAKAPAFVLPGRNSHRSSALPQLTDAERARLVQRVARALETAGEGGQMRLRLSPPELGSLRMDVSVQHGVLTAHVEAETPQARMLLLDNLPALRERLQEQNVKIERFDVDLMNQPSGGQPQSYRQREQNTPEEPGLPAANQRASVETASETRPAVARRVGGGEKLNVVI